MKKKKQCGPKQKLCSPSFFFVVVVMKEQEQKLNSVHPMRRKISDFRSLEETLEEQSREFSLPLILQEPEARCAPQQ